MRRFIISFVMTWGWPDPPTANRKNHDRAPIMPSVPQGEIASGSSAISVPAMPARPPSTALRAAAKTKSAATIMMAPCTRSV